MRGGIQNACFIRGANPSAPSSDPLGFNGGRAEVPFWRRLDPVVTFLYPYFKLASTPLTVPRLLVGVPGAECFLIHILGKLWSFERVPPSFSCVPSRIRPFFVPPPPSPSHIDDPLILTTLSYRRPFPTATGTAAIELGPFNKNLC